MMNNKKIIMLAGKGASTNILYNALKKDFTISKIILEEPVNKIQFLKKRIKKLGLGEVFGQILFQAVIVKYLELVSLKRKKEILHQYELDDSAIPEEKIIHVNSINDEAVLRHLYTQSPELVIVNGTRIISKAILNSIPAKFINMHVGITPKYRGVHGGYWALANNDMANCGVTIHLVDEGIDTGKILYQKKITITNKDNFVTYPLLQLAKGIKYMKMAITGILNGSFALTNGAGPSKLWHHPTIWKYLLYRIKRGIK